MEQQSYYVNQNQQQLKHGTVHQIKKNKGVYFVHAYSAFKPGSNQNFNGIVAKIYAKGNTVL